MIKHVHKVGPFSSLPSLRPGKETNHLQYFAMALIGIMSAYPSVMKYTHIAANKIKFSFVYAAHNYVSLLLAHGVPYH